MGIIAKIKAGRNIYRLSGDARHELRGVNPIQHAREIQRIGRAIHSEYNSLKRVNVMERARNLHRIGKEVNKNIQAFNG